MPLPPAPTKRAALLSPAALNTPVQPSPRRAQKPEAAASAQKPPVADLFESRTAEAAAKPRLLKGKEPASPVPASMEGFKKERIKKPGPAAKPAKAKYTGPAKLFVLDTNVLMHDPMCLFRFE
jgi:PhoH-like ATPase